MARDASLAGRESEAWVYPETQVSLPACLFVTALGIAHEKMHSLKAHCQWLLSHPSPLFFFPPLFVLQILMMNIPSCTAESPILHPRMQQRSNTEAMSATNALLPAQPEPFLFNLGISKCTTLRSEERRVGKEGRFRG